MANSNSIHLLVVSLAFAESEQDTSSVTYLQNYLVHLIDNHNIRVTVVAMQYPFKRKHYSWNGIPVMALGGYKKPIGSRLISWMWCFRRLIKTHKKEPFTHIHAFWLKESALFAYLLNFRIKVPLIITPMGTELNQRNPFRFILGKKSIRFIALSHFHREYLSGFSKHLNADVIPWGLTSLSEEIPQSKKTDILFVGFLNKTKNFGLFLSIVKEVSETLPEIKAGVIGDYFGLGDFERQAEQQGIRKNIDFYGLLPNEEVLKMMRESKILLHTSDFETQGYAMLEALASGMYVVSRQVGIAEASERWKIAGDKDEFVRATLQLLRDYKPFPNGLVPYTLEETCRKYLEIYTG